MNDLANFEGTPTGNDELSMDKKLDRNQHGARETEGDVHLRLKGGLISSEALSAEPAVDEPSLATGAGSRAFDLSRVKDVDGGGGSVDEEEDEAEEEVEAIEEPALETGSRPPAFPRTTSMAPPGVILLLQLSTYSLLAFITIWGVLVRLGLEWIGGFSRDSVFVLIWPQMVGCLVMGFAVDRKRGLEKIFPPLFTMLGTGFCGSITSFSSFMTQVFIAFANINTPNLGRFSGFMNGLAITIITMGLSIISLQLGRSLSSSFPSHHRDTPRRSKMSPHRRRTYPLSLLLGPLFWIGAILLAILGPTSFRGRATFAIAFAPPGTWLRFELSRAFNPRYPTFPLGTLLANLFACTLLGIMMIIQRMEGRSGVGCAVAQGIEDGFCGSLSTVSTLVVELRNLKRGDGWRYFGVSWIAAQAILLVVIGSYVFSQPQSTMCSFE